MILLNRAAAVVFVAALTLSGLGCVPEPTGTPCATVADCKAAPGVCVENTCVNKICGTANIAVGMRVGVQTAGDCAVSQCDGSGHVALAIDDTDLPVDSSDCTDDVCTAGVPSNPARAVGSACGAGAMLKCDGQASCVACTAPADCGAATECQARTCVAGTCGVNNAARGTALASQTAGDCKVSQCDGNGAEETVNDDADVRVDATSCTNDVCTAGVPSNPPVSAGATCSEGTGTLCNGAGVCVACVAATDCPGTDGECQQRSCAAGVCGFTYTAVNTPLASQTARDCKKSVCDGAGGVTIGNDNTDLPNDNNACTVDTCAAGTPTFANVTAGTACGTSGVCSAGACVGCVGPSDCPGSDDECKARTCVSNVCGVTFTTVNTPVASQTANNCRKNVCDGSGNTVNQNDATDLPADDGNQCTTEACSSGVPSFPAVSVNTTCNQNGGTFCSAAGSCVACTAAAQCPGSDTECQTRTCTNNACGVSFTAAGFVTTAQTPNDCKENHCNGAGGIVVANKDSDLPADDGNLCTYQACSAGRPAFPPTGQDSPCGPGLGSFCNGSGVCVACNDATQCPGSDTECQTRTCTTNACGFNYRPNGFVLAAQTAGDCKQAQCDGAGAITPVAFNTDVPLDTNQCTADVCTAGVPSNPALSVGTACNQSGGTICDGAATCVNPPTVVSTTPADGSTPVAGPTISVTFSTAMNPATLTGQTTAGACSGSIQVSLDNFASCVAFSPVAAVMSAAFTTATVTPAPGLLVNQLYKIRVTTAAAGAVALQAQFTQATGFITTSPNLCNGSLVISQFFGGGGGSAAVPNADYVELHNRGTTPVTMTNWSIQYAGAGGSSWSMVSFSGTIQPSAYFLVRLQNTQPTGTTLPTPDATGTAINMSGSAGKVALVSNNTALAVSCPTSAAIVDFVGYGSQALNTGCWEGPSTTVSTAPASSTTASFRVQSGCADVNNNTSDFITASPGPRNSAAAPVVCGCTAQNESNATLEADYCTTQFPLSLTTAAGASTGNIYGRLFEAGATDTAATANPNVRAQVGYGLPNSNPQYEAGWTWTNATYNAAFVDASNDEYQATFTAPAAGTYRYVYRFSLDQGVSWTYCDANNGATGGDSGAGSNANLTFELGQLPVLTVP